MRRLVHVLLAALVVAGGVAVDQSDHYQNVTRSFVTSGDAGEEVPVWPGVLVVHGARSATVLDDDWDGELTTRGAWVAVDLSLAGGDQPLLAPRFWLEDASGREFAASNRLSSASAITKAQPGSPVRGEVVFEVPRDALGPVTLIARQRSEGQLGAVARIRLDAPEPEGDAPLVPASATLTRPAP